MYQSGHVGHFLAVNAPEKGQTTMAQRPAKTATQPAHRTRTNGNRTRSSMIEPTETADVVEETRGSLEEIRKLAEADTGAPSRAGETAADSNVTDELSGGGVAFGEFVKSVGLAVAAAQAELDKTLVTTAKALSETSINTVAVFEQQIKDDDGTMDKGVVHTQSLPLTNYIMPTAYQWSRVFLEADMNVQEFNSRSGFNIQQKSFSADARLSGGYSTFGGASIQGSAGMAYSNSSTGVDSSFSADNAAGKLHMEATLEPRADIELPRPFVLQKGPRMQLLVGSKEETHQENDPSKPVDGQKVTLTCVLQKSNGDKMEADKPLSVSISDPTLNYTASGKTDANGSMTIVVTRRGASYDPANPVRAMVRVSFGLVSQSAGIVL